MNIEERMQNCEVKTRRALVPRRDAPMATKKKLLILGWILLGVGVCIIAFIHAIGPDVRYVSILRFTRDVKDWEPLGEDDVEAVRISAAEAKQMNVVLESDKRFVWGRNVTMDVRKGQYVEWDHLEEKDWPGRIRKQIAHLPRDRQVKDLAARLSGRPDGEINAAAELLVEMGEEAVPQLRELLRSDDLALRVAACECLRNIGPPAREAVADLKRILRENQPHGELGVVARFAGGAIGGISDDAEQIALECLRVPDVESAEKGGWVLAGMKTKGQHVLVRFLQDSDPLLRSRAASCGTNGIGSDRNPAIPELKAALLGAAVGDSDVAVRTKAAHSLAGMIPPGGMADRLPRIRQALKEEKVEMTKAALALLLMRAGEDYKEGLAEFLPFLRHERSEIRELSLIFLEKAGPAIKATLPNVITLLKDREADVRIRACLTLKVLLYDAAPAVPALAEALSDSDPRVRLAAAMTLRTIAPVAKAAIPSLEKAARDSDADVARYAKKALQAIQPDYESGLIFPENAERE